ncbi:calcium-activated chloride channel regulator 1-like [Watersipora subatra]|uniref:calcium-activated chloride channel regulator 1-like n=1 Tax=Watersipora subatra TaxID=2589382 RepID=UPI00355BF05C
MALQNHMIVHITCLMTVLVTSSNIGNDRQDINLSSDGGYTDILIAIDERVTEDPEIIFELQEYFTGASEVLRIATENRLYFKNFTIVVPENWTHSSDWMEPEEEETVTRARIIVAEANLAYGNEPYTLQPGGCGQEGDFIHFTSEYLTRSSNDANTYKPVKRVVKEFAKLKWGLFDENIPINDTVTPRFYFKDNAIQPEGCIETVKFDFKDFSQCVISNSPPPYPCDFILKEVLGSASLLSYDYAESVTGFCKDNKEGATHNILSSNLQNANCQDRSAWSVIIQNCAKNNTFYFYLDYYSSSHNNHIHDNIYYNIDNLHKYHINHFYYNSGDLHKYHINHFYHNPGKLHKYHINHFYYNSGDLHKYHINYFYYNPFILYLTYNSCTANRSLSDTMRSGYTVSLFRCFDQYGCIRQNHYHVRSSSVVYYELLERRSCCRNCLIF